MDFKNSESLFAKAKTLFPGGVNSPVRAFKSVGGTPIFIKKGQGAYITDEDDNTYLDFCSSWGPMILGHAHPSVIEAISKTAINGTSFGAPTRLENELADLIISNHQYIEKLRFVSSGTEAVMSAIRLARGITGKNKIIKFDGCYHGHVDSLMVKAGSGLATFGVSTSAGIPPSFAAETIVLPLNDPFALEDCLHNYADQIAAIIIEPIPANNGLLLQTKSFLQYLRTKCDEYNVLLIFDEVISGFRVGFEGAAALYSVSPDIITFGKIIGGGLPVGAYGASEKFMSHISPEGNVYQAGTLSGNPLAMAAGISTLKLVLEDGFYEKLATKTQDFVQIISNHCSSKGYDMHIQSIGSIFWIAFNKEKIMAADQIDPTSMNHFKILFHRLLENKIYFGPSGYEVGFVSAAHTESELANAATVINSILDEIFKK